jgi:glycerophosphoryl diester phosphodiesterase
MSFSIRERKLAFSICSVTNRSASLLAVALLTGISLTLMPQMARADDCKEPVIIIGHRGASGYRPEHTLASYKLAIEQGADFIEPDLVSTKDGVLVARHENEISGTTDVASHPEFADRKATKLIDGTEITGWFTEDFTLAELKTLRARERLPDLRPDNAEYDGQFLIPTLEDVIRLAQVESRVKHRAIGIYPETKHPSYFASIGLAFEEKLVRTLHRSGYRGPNAPVFIQSFETGNLKQLRALTHLPLVQLIDAAGAPYDLKATGDTRTYADLVTPEGLTEIATYADGVGLNKEWVIPRDAEAHLRSATAVIDDAHAVGLLVHAWTFRAENNFLPADFRLGEVPLDPTDPAYLKAHGNLTAELTAYFAAGLDGVFTDFPDLGVAARAALPK